jgi:hypothetical protein
MPRSLTGASSSGPPEGKHRIGTMPHRPQAVVHFRCLASRGRSRRRSRTPVELCAYGLPRYAGIVSVRGDVSPARFIGQPCDVAMKGLGSSRIAEHPEIAARICLPMWSVARAVAPHASLLRISTVTTLEASNETVHSVRTPIGVTERDVMSPSIALERLAVQSDLPAQARASPLPNAVAHPHRTARACRITRDKMMNERTFVACLLGLIVAEWR